MLITAHISKGEVYFRDESTEGPAPEGWWNRYPRLALYIAANCDENCACPSVGAEQVEATEAEMQKAEDQLQWYPYDLVYEMGYHGLVHNTALEDQPFMAHEIVNRLY